MRTDRLRDLADHIESHPEDFNMSVWVPHHLCGTACCIAGTHTLRQHAAAGIPPPHSSLVADWARRDLGLTRVQGAWLFLGMWRQAGVTPRSLLRQWHLGASSHVAGVTAREAAAAIRALASVTPEAAANPSSIVVTVTEES